MGLVYGRDAAVLIDSGTTMTEARQIARDVRTDAVFVPGHGAVVDAAYIRRQGDWLHRL